MEMTPPRLDKSRLDLSCDAKSRVSRHHLAQPSPALRSFAPCSPVPCDPASPTGLAGPRPTLPRLAKPRLVKSRLAKSRLAQTLLAALTAVALPLAALAQEPSDPALIAQGRYLAIAGDCAACHTAPGGADYAGGLAISTPIGTIYSTNITPSKTAGIGDYSLKDFARALRQGLRKDGAPLYPAMPYTAYARISDADVAALYAYVTSLKPVDQPSPATALPFPFDIRLSMLGWNLLFAHDQPFAPDPGQTAAWNRGAYLVQGLAHCATCHTPRNLLMAEDSSQAMAGAALGTWFAPNITPDPKAGIGSWSAADLVTYLTTGQSPTGSQAGGPMREAIDKSFSRMAPEDVAAMATYLRSLPPQAAHAAPGPGPLSAPQATDFDLIAGKAAPGAELYDAHCAACHQASGEGSRGLPALYGNAALTRRPTADNVAMAILTGITPAKGQAMPGFAAEMSDAQIATLTNYAFATFGVPQVQITAERVAELRAGGVPSPLVKAVQLGLALALLIVGLGAGAWVLRARKRAA